MSDVDSLFEARAIVVAIAAQDPPLDLELGYCMWCRTKGDAFYPKDHEPSCPWRQAKEWESKHEG